MSSERSDALYEAYVDAKLALAQAQVKALKARKTADAAERALAAAEKKLHDALCRFSDSHQLA